MKKSSIKINRNKKQSINVDGDCYDRFPIKTHLITDKDDIVEVCVSNAKRFLKDGDILFVSEKIVAISQGRAFHLSKIEPRFLARHLYKFVHKSKYGIGLANPYTMELALRQAGTFRILLAGFVSAVTKPFGIRGLFYIVAGNNVNAIDGPCKFAIPPYNEYAKMAPKNSAKVAGILKRQLGVDVVVIDANDLGVNILGKSTRKISKEFCANVFKDNPIGQSREQTPLCIVRPAF